MTDIWPTLILRTLLEGYLFSSPGTRYATAWEGRDVVREVRPPIFPDLLNQIDVGVGTILSATNVPNSEKLVALEVSFGDHKRTVL